MKTVLMLCYSFPPSTGTGTHRPSKFAKYLPRFGWEPVVVTVKERYIPHPDSTLSPDVAESTIIRTSCLLNMQKAVYLFTKREGGQSTGPQARPALPKRLFTRFVRSINRQVVSKVLVPDSAVLWLPHALFRGLQCIRTKKIDLIYATGDPWSTFLTALLLSKLTGLPYVLDFRDHWTRDAYYEKKGLIASFEKWLEKMVIRHASKVIAANEVITEDFLAAYADLNRGKFITITNGYDNQDFDSVTSPENPVTNSRVQIAFTGKFYSAGRNPQNFLNAVEKVVQVRQELREKLRILFMGHIDSKWERYLRSSSLSDIIEIRPHGSRAESINCMRMSDILLIITGRERAQAPLKLFEYMATGKPILALTPDDSACARILRETGAGVLVSDDDVHGIANRLLHLIDNQHTYRRKDHIPGQIAKYTRHALTEKLANVFDEVSGLPSASHAD